MTFIISPKGVKNTKSTTAKFGGAGKVQIGGDFHNTGKVEIDTKANLNVIGGVVNAGDFQIKDYIAERQYQIIESAIESLKGKPKTLLKESYDALKDKEIKKSNNLFKKFFTYIKSHPELITGSVQILLQLILKQ